jgi:intracellular multiplication protein IcmV
MAEEKKPARKKRGLIKRVFNPRKWMGYDEVKQSGHQVMDMARNLTTVRKPTRKETFEESVKRQNLTEKDLKARMKALFITSWVYLGFGIALFFYGLYALTYLSLFAVLVCFILSAIALALAYRDSFFYFQMKKRKLGCTVAEWIKFITRRG